MARGSMQNIFLHGSLAVSELFFGAYPRLKAGKSRTPKASRVEKAQATFTAPFHPRHAHPAGRRNVETPRIGTTRGARRGWAARERLRGAERGGGASWPGASSQRSGRRVSVARGLWVCLVCVSFWFLGGGGLFFIVAINRQGPLENNQNQRPTHHEGSQDPQNPF